MTTPIQLVRRINSKIKPGANAATQKKVLTDEITKICQNKSAGKCTSTGYSDYFVRDFNPGCFASILSLLDIARRNHGPVFFPASIPSRYTAQIAENVGRSGNGDPSVPVSKRTARRNVSASTCACFKTRAECRGQEGCEWSSKKWPDPKLGGRAKYPACVPYIMEQPGFPGVAGRTGQKIPAPFTGDAKDLRGNYARNRDVSRKSWRTISTLATITV